MLELIGMELVRSVFTAISHIFYDVMISYYCILKWMKYNKDHSYEEFEKLYELQNLYLLRLN